MEALALCFVATTWSLGGLLGWKWYLAERRFALQLEDKERDAAFKTIDPRLKLIEEVLKNAEWARAFKK